MKRKTLTLNLAYPEQSQLKCKINRYPDGQQDVVLDMTTVPEDINYCEVTIITRLNNFKDIELLLSATSDLRHLEVEYIRVFVPYVLGARSDRKFVTGGSFYIKDVLAPVINLKGYTSFTCVDPHSDVLGFIDNFRAIHQAEILKTMLVADLNICPFLLVSPDPGASKKVYDVATAIGYKDEIIIGNKHRDVVSGQITGVGIGAIELDPEKYLDKNLLICDDICDGGRTFIEIAKRMNEVMQGNHVGKKILYVTHGIFSSGLAELEKHFDLILCTNSYADFKPHPKLKQFHVFNYDL